MLTIKEVNKIRRENPNLSIMEILTELMEKYELDAQDVAVFVRSNKTLKSEFEVECTNRNLIKVDKRVNLKDIF